MCTPEKTALCALSTSWLVGRTVTARVAPAQWARPTALSARRRTHMQTAAAAAAVRRQDGAWGARRTRTPATQEAAHPRGATPRARPRGTRARVRPTRTRPTGAKHLRGTPARARQIRTRLVAGRLRRGMRVPGRPIHMRRRPALDGVPRRTRGQAQARALVHGVARHQRARPHGAMSRLGVRTQTREILGYEHATRPTTSVLML